MASKHHRRLPRPRNTFVELSANGVIAMALHRAGFYPAQFLIPVAMLLVLLLTAYIFRYRYFSPSERLDRFTGDPQYYSHTERTWKPAEPSR
jgi:hypothetical protein